MTARKDAPPKGVARRIDGAVPFGIALIVLGVLLALDNLEVVDASDLLAGWWPVAVIAAGLWWAATGTPVSGTIVAGVGGLILLSNLEVIEVSIGPLIFPSILLIVGGAMLQAGLRIRAARVELHEPSAPGGEAGAALSATAVFGDARLTVTDGETEQGRVLVSASSVFGDVRIDVPSGWRIEDRLTRVLGDVSLPTRQPDYPESPVVALYGVVLLGDVKVRYVDLSEAR